MKKKMMVLMVLLMTVSRPASAQWMSAGLNSWNIQAVTADSTGRVYAIADSAFAPSALPNVYRPPSLFRLAGSGGMDTVLTQGQYQQGGGPMPTTGNYVYGDVLIVKDSLYTVRISIGSPDAVVSLEKRGMSGSGFQYEPMGFGGNLSQILRTAAGTMLVADSTGAVLRSSSSNPIVPFTMLPVGRVRQLHQTPDGSIYAAATDSLCKSTDDGITWQRLPLPRKPLSLSGFLPSGQEGVVYCGTDSGVYVSINGGTVWTPITVAGMSDKAVKALAVVRAPLGSATFAATDNIVYASDGTLNTGLPTAFVSKRLHYDAATNTLYLATNVGLFKTAPRLAAPNAPDAKPDFFDLSQNYPNPFNPETAISYQLIAASEVSLKVFDVLGREVATLVNERKPAGAYRVRFNASQRSSGIYFYRLTASGSQGTFSETKKMVLLK